MPRFVLLFHDCPADYDRPSHWDFMLEVGSALRTWALNELPSTWEAAYEKTRSSNLLCRPLAAGDVVEAKQLGDHRIAYLEFEGPLTGGRGSVTRIDTGSYRELTGEKQSPAHLQIDLTGGLLHGAVMLTPLPSDDTRWILDAREIASDQQ
jgi:DNA polymerase Ligase (LigD)